MARDEFLHKVRQLIPHLGLEHIIARWNKWSSSLTADQTAINDCLVRGGINTKHQANLRVQTYSGSILMGNDLSADLSDSPSLNFTLLINSHALLCSNLHSTTIELFFCWEQWSLLSLEYYGIIESSSWLQNTPVLAWVGWDSIQLGRGCRILW